MKCPCEECISFAICNIEVKGMKPIDVISLALHKNCLALYEFLNLDRLDDDEHLTVFNQEEINYTKKLFKTPALIDLEEN